MSPPLDRESELPFKAAVHDLALPRHHRTQHPLHADAGRARQLLIPSAAGGSADAADESTAALEKENAELQERLAVLKAKLKEEEASIDNELVYWK